MPIRAESADGVTHEFPDGTDPSVIDRAMMDYALKMNPPGFPQDKPGTEYGDILPFARDTETGKLSLAIPEIIRQPARGAIEWGRALTGHRALNEPESPDMASAAMLGAGVAPGAGKLGLPGTARVLEQAESHMKPEAQSAHDAGYVLPPSTMTDSPSTLAKGLSAWGGKPKLSQRASEINQEITNSLAAKSLGLKSDTVLTPQVFKDVRAKAGASYEKVAKALPTITPDDEFKEAIAGLGGANSEAAQFFPGQLDNAEIKQLQIDLSKPAIFPPRAGLQLVKQLRANATANFKTVGDPSKHALGLAQRQAADAIDSLIERNIQNYEGNPVSGRAGTTTLVNEYRNARQLIAKSYDVEGATNAATGDVSAAGLAKLSSKGRPFTGELKTIADAAEAFPKSFRNVAQIGGVEDYSHFDFLLSAYAIGRGNPTLGTVVLGGPLARKVALSHWYQDRLAKPPATPSASPVQPSVNALFKTPPFPSGDANDSLNSPPQ